MPKWNMFATLLLASAITSVQASQDGPDYVAQILKLRKENEDGLKSDSGWLTVSGLHWLTEGKVGFAMADGGSLQLPASQGKPLIGTLVRSGDKISVEIPEDSPVRVNGKKVASSPVGGQDTITFGSVTMVLIVRGSRIGIRVYDKNSKARREFTGEKWFDVDVDYRVKARYVAYDKPRQMMITNVLGDTAPVSNPGYVQFTLKGKSCRLEAQDSGVGLFFNFKDLTNGKSTYPAGRFLDTSKPKDGFVTVDFNLAVNPPCAFTDFATCPLPPKENNLDIEVMAGEKAYRHHSEG